MWLLAGVGPLVPGRAALVLELRAWGRRSKKCGCVDSLVLCQLGESLGGTPEPLLALPTEVKPHPGRGRAYRAGRHIRGAAGGDAVGQLPRLLNGYSDGGGVGSNSGGGNPPFRSGFPRIGQRALARVLLRR